MDRKVEASRSGQFAGKPKAGTGKLPLLSGGGTFLSPRPWIPHHGFAPEMPAAEFESRFVLLRIERPRPVEIDSAPGADTTHREQLEGRRLRATHLPGESVIKGNGRSHGEEHNGHASTHQHSSLRCTGSRIDVEAKACPVAGRFPSRTADAARAGSGGFRAVTVRDAERWRPPAETPGGDWASGVLLVDPCGLNPTLVNLKVSKVGNCC